MRIALLSNVTLEVLAGLLKKEHDLWLAPGFGSWRETALNVPDELKAFDPEAVFLILDDSHATVASSDAAAAKAALEAALSNTTVVIPDLKDLFDSTVPLFSTPTPSSPYDERMWKLASMPWSLKGLRALHDEIDRLCALMKGGAKKVLALDFDGVLWQGVVGEDGVKGIVPNAELQRAVKTLQRRGVLLVALSKNNADDVAPVWDDPRMILKREDFVEERIDWNDKPANLAAAAQALNLAADAFVFLDDNPAERAQMKAALPDVTVPEWPVSIRHLARLYFPEFRTTDEDRVKTGLYRAEVQRQALSARLSYDDYLRSLAIRTDIHPIVESEFARVAQLSQKSNQFNVCTNRYTPADIAHFAADSACLLLTLASSDRFGDQGLVGYVLVRGTEILDFVLSCRAMNRRLEFALEAALEREVSRRGGTGLSATWRKTLKNAPVRDLFERFGFTCSVEREEEKRYERILG